ncbi:MULTISPECIES: DUF805 domain-containing protein [Pasteurellaceae]|uniref:DUF805 domain-containing protein n=1 Tax=Pasteurella atlantica TaxID=2827233 RepID=A0AAW8CN18_9PAST|nr:DUF805 domain-containing protein [Pasteurella atlantica]MBR0574511.1 DUF805 domain-containing protein [Pasteurella atlantica]MDP8042572.1 DUF805 domain-containing protein [Pasteurella atlantica]MDP8046723.1 DUF805 domain-containing protein [Pasteurella atlantica]MDP8123547.1 DUF805 domain-containing protein [Pasteurella atlantica]MDP8143342.1 DUF805 domain-containing protein [Pasteurella atlantica]
MFKTIINHYLHSLKNTLNYKRRATRTELCWFSLISGLIFMLLLQVARITNIHLVYFILRLFSFIIIFPSVSLIVRRLHDLGKSGW